MRRVLAAMVVAVVASGCGAVSGGDHTAADSGIRGVVVMGPRCPVEIQGSPCPDAPWTGLVQATSGDARIRRRTDDAGRFELRLDPGRWTIGPVIEGGGPPFARSVTVTVEPHAFTQVTLTVDSGIR